jgi:uncharacterized protein (DUF2267 family)
LSASVLAFAASLGLTALLLPDTVGGTDFVYYVPLVAGVLLVGLGSDYNVFITGRLRAEARRRRHSEAIAVGAPAASRAITVAGITLASTFALLWLVPVRPFRELAVLMTIGVLLDALLVRPLLIPALIALVGRATWWPVAPERPIGARPMLRRVAEGTGLPIDEAEQLTHATLATLAERIPPRESRELARHLPARLSLELDRPRPRERGAPFDADEFVRRVARRTGDAPEVARDEARVVLTTLAEALPATEVDYVRAALSDDFRPLLGDAPRRADVGP